MKPSDNRLFFVEEQRFRQAWLWTAIIVMDIAVCLPFLSRYIGLLKSLNFRPGDSFSLLVAPLICFAITVLFVNLRLVTKIDASGIALQFKPFHRQPIFIGNKDIKSYFIRTYRPIIEYGGWGIKQGGEGMAYSVSGNQGLQLVLADGRKILIGTQKPEQLLNALNTAIKSSGDNRGMQ